MGLDEMPSKEDQFRAVADLVFKCLDMQRVFIKKDEYFIERRNGTINGKGARLPLRLP